MKKIINDYCCPSHGIIVNTQDFCREWQRKYGDILDFITEKGRLPKNSGTEYEYELNKYYTTHYNLYESEMMDKEQKILFERIYFASSSKEERE